MRHLSAQLALVLISLVGCGDGPAPDDVGPDPGIDASDATEEVRTCRASTVPGCHEACEFLYDCAVNSSLADRIMAAFSGLGFSGDDFSDCTGCVDRCEAGTGDADALACFARIADSVSCPIGAADPTVAANAINECCEGELGSTFCVGTCQAGATLPPDIFPACQPFLDLPSPSSCAGVCPAVASASAVAVSGDAVWTLHQAAISDDGQVAIVGRAQGGTLDLGAGALAAPSTGSAYFVAYFDATGTARWARALGDGHPPLEMDAEVLARPYFQDRVAFDSDGNVVVLVELRGSVDLGAGTLSTAGETDHLLASFAADGTLRWARALGGPMAEGLAELSADAAGLLFAAEFQGTVDFGGGPLASAGGQDVAVVRLDNDGGHVFSRAFGGPGEERAVAIVGHPSGDYTLTGAYSDGADFGAGAVSEAGMTDSYVARYGADGTLRWAQTRGGSDGFDYGFQIGAAGEDAIVADYFGSTMIDEMYGPQSVEGITWIHARYAADGTIPWAHGYLSAMTTRAVIAFDIDVDAMGRVQMAAFQLSPTLDLGGGPLTSAGAADIAIASYTGAGAHRWSFRMGTVRYDPGPRAIHRLASGELMVVGMMTGDLDYGSGVLTNTNRDLYFLRFAAE